MQKTIQIQDMSDRDAFTTWRLPQDAIARYGQGIDTGKSKMTLTGHTHWVFSLAFSPDGKSLVSGGVDGIINLWDAHTGEHKKTLTGHTAWVRSIAFNPDGKTFVSGSDDGTVLLWKINP